MRLFRPKAGNMECVVKIDQNNQEVQPKKKPRLKVDKPKLSPVDSQEVKKMTPVEPAHILEGRANFIKLLASWYVERRYEVPNFTVSEPVHLYDFFRKHPNEFKGVDNVKAILAYFRNDIGFLDQETQKAIKGK